MTLGIDTRGMARRTSSMGRSQADRQHHIFRNMTEPISTARMPPTHTEHKQEPDLDIHLVVYSVTWLCIYIDCMPTNGLNERHAHRCQLLTQVGSASDTVSQIIRFKDFLQTDGNGFHIPATQTAVGGKPSVMMSRLVQASLSSLLRMVRNPPILTSPSFFRLMMAASARPNIS